MYSMSGWELIIYRRNWQSRVGGDQHELSFSPSLSLSLTLPLAN
ncbi:MAG: hypothetical protein ACKERG_01820 [Candidatus Hodgkinia cicadicola]